MTLGKLLHSFKPQVLIHKMGIRVMTLQDCDEDYLGK